MSDGQSDNVCVSECEDVTACELCGSSDLCHEIAVRQWTLMRCRTCGTVFTSPRLTERSLKRHYERGYYEGTAQYFSCQSSPVTADHSALVSEVSGFLGNDERTSLDIGCGGGQLVEAFSAAGFSAMGTEPSEAACSAAARLGRNVRNLELIAFPDASFDCVTAMHVLEHVSHPRWFLAEVARITKPNGIVVIEVPNYGCKASRRLGARWLPLYPDTHLFHYTPDTLQLALRTQGFAPLRVRRLGGLGMLAQFAPTAAQLATQDTKTEAGASPPNRRKRWKSALWAMRAPILALPGARTLFRWMIWDLLGHGEYVRVLARKPST